MLAQHSAQERLYLYAEGIEKMTSNSALPRLFRDILRNAYIPYRDPETLNLFLKEIAEFSYDDSEELGNAFEFLLSIMGSQGDAGQFRTPRHIIDMMVEIIAPAKNEVSLTLSEPAPSRSIFTTSEYKSSSFGNSFFINGSLSSSVSTKSKSRLT
jgi:type I restriction enzyme M protein